MGLAGKTWVRGRGVEGRLRDKPHTPPAPVLTGLCRWHRVAGFVGCGDHSPGRRGFAGRVRRFAATHRATPGAGCGDCVARMQAEGRNPGALVAQGAGFRCAASGCLLNDPAGGQALRNKARADAQAYGLTAGLRGYERLLGLAPLEVANAPASPAELRA